MPEKRRLQSTVRSAAGERRSVLASPDSNVPPTAAAATDLAGLGRYVLAEAWRRTSEDVLARRPGSADSALHHGIDEVGA